MSIYLTLETIAGGEINHGIFDAVGVASKLGIWVKININGIEVMIGPNDHAETLMRNYAKAREREATFVSANVIPSGP